MAAILRSQGASSFEPRVVAQLLEFSYRHTGEVLHEAQLYAAHRTRQPPGVAPLSVEDVRLAAQCSSVHAFTEPLGGDQLARLAESVNATPLPAVPRRLGLVYPANVALLAPTFQVSPLQLLSASRAALTPPPPCASQVLPAVKLAPRKEEEEAPPAPVAAAEAGPSKAAAGQPGGSVRLPQKRSRIDALAAPPDEGGDVDVDGDTGMLE